jgi:hypothetical protein
VRGTHDEDRGVGPEEEVDVVAVELQGGLGSNNESENYGRLGCVNMLYCDAGNGTRRTFVCQTVIDVAVMTANR